MPAVLPNELKVSNWETLKKTLPAPNNKDTTVTPTLTTLATAIAAVNWTILEQCVENANAAEDSTDRRQIIAAGNTQLKKLDPLTNALKAAKTAIGKLKANVQGVPAFAKMFEQTDSLDKWVTGFKTQTTTQLSNVGTQAANRAGTLNLDKVLATPALREKFVEFLKSEHSYENLEFLEAVKAGPTEATYEKYIRRNLVNLDSATREALKACYEPPVPSPAVWKAAQAEIMKLLSQDTFTRFKLTL